MPNDSEILWNIYQEHCEWERHHEQQRASATNLLLAIAAGVLSVVTFDGEFSHSDLPLTIFVIIQGFFGALFVSKQYERFRTHQQRANEYRDALDALHPNIRIKSLRSVADEKIGEQYPHLRRIRLHKLWLALHLLIAIFGIVLTLMILLEHLS